MNPAIETGYGTCLLAGPVERPRRPAKIQHQRICPGCWTRRFYDREVTSEDEDVREAAKLLARPRDTVESQRARPLLRRPDGKNDSMRKTIVVLMPDSGGPVLLYAPVYGVGKNSRNTCKITFVCNLKTGIEQRKYLFYPGFWSAMGCWRSPDRFDDM